MCDVGQIQNVLTRQKILVDERDAESLRECYTADMSQTLRFNGAEPQHVSGRDEVAPIGPDRTEPGDRLCLSAE